jgi:UrcA family protein
MKIQIICAPILIALCVATSVSVTAYAATGATPTASARVTLDDLDLNTPLGLETARQRLHAMARNVCDRVSDDLDLSHQPNFVKCVDDTLANALRQITNPQLANAPKAAPATRPAAAPAARTANVLFKGLDLSTPEGVRTAHERLRAAARIACSGVEDDLDAAHQAHFARRGLALDDRCAARQRNADARSPSRFRFDLDITAENLYPLLHTQQTEMAAGGSLIESP